MDCDEMSSYFFFEPPPLRPPCPPREPAPDALLLLPPLDPLLRLLDPARLVPPLLRPLLPPRFDLDSIVDSCGGPVGPSDSGAELPPRTFLAKLVPRKQTT
jgi:hypothetical protein